MGRDISRRSAVTRPSDEDRRKHKLSTGRRQQDDLLAKRHSNLGDSSQIGPLHEGWQGELMGKTYLDNLKRRAMYTDATPDLATVILSVLFHKGRGRLE